MISFPHDRAVRARPFRALVATCVACVALLTAPSARAQDADMMRGPRPNAPLVYLTITPAPDSVYVDGERAEYVPERAFALAALQDAEIVAYLDGFVPIRKRYYLQLGEVRREAVRFGERRGMALLAARIGAGQYVYRYERQIVPAVLILPALAVGAAQVRGGERYAALLGGTMLAATVVGVVRAEHGRAAMPDRHAGRVRAAIGATHLHSQGGSARHGQNFVRTGDDGVSRTISRTTAYYVGTDAELDAPGATTIRTDAPGIGLHVNVAFGEWLGVQVGYQRAGALEYRARAAASVSELQNGRLEVEQAEVEVAGSLTQHFAEVLATARLVRLLGHELRAGAGGFFRLARADFDEAEPVAQPGSSGSSPSDVSAILFARAGGDFGAAFLAELDTPLTRRLSLVTQLRVYARPAPLRYRLGSSEADLEPLVSTLAVLWSTGLAYTFL